MLPNFNNNGPCYELFSSATDIIKYWKQKGKIMKEFESHTKSYIFSLQFGGVSMLSIPINEKHSLQINNSCLLFQFILFNTKSFSIEIVIRDKNDTKRRFNLTTSVKEIDSKSLYIKIPLIDYPLNIWTNLIIDLESLTNHYFKTQTFKSIDNIHITGCLKIRKIFSLRTKEEPVLRSIDMGKSALVNLLLLETGNIIKNDIKIIGINNVYINNININSKNIQNPLPGNRKGMNSPPSHNVSKFSTTSDINLNKHKNYYRKSNENNNLNEYNNSNNNLSEGLNITPITNNIINRKQMENLSKKAKDNILDAKKFVKGLPDLTKYKNNIKYAALKNMKNNNMNNIANIGNNSIMEENNNSNNSNKLFNTNTKEKGKSLGKYVKHQQNKKRNKSNNPYINHKNKKQNENIDFIISNIDNKDNKNISNKNVIREENNSILNNNNVNKINKKDNIINNKEKKVNKNSITPIKSREKENREILNNNIYYNKKEQEISMDDYHVVQGQNQIQNKKNEENINVNKFKFNNISLPNTIKENKENKNVENDNKQNKYSNYNNMLLESGFDIKNIPIYDSIEEIAEWPADLNNNVNNVNNIEKMGDKLILLDSGNNQKNNENNENDIIEGDDFLEISSLFKKKDTLRPYTPPIEELVPVNPKKMKGDSNMKCSMDKKNGLMNTNRILKNYENLIYNQDKGLFYDPKTNIYYDIKAK